MANNQNTNLEYLWDACPRIGFNTDNFKAFLIWAKLDVGANDIFIETNEPLGIKKNGITYNVTKRIFGYEEISKLLSDIYMQSAPTQLRSGEALNFPYSFIYGDNDESLRFRVNVSACNSVTGASEGIEIVLRPSDGEPPSIEALSVCPELVELTNQKDGFVLVTGPTGSGKTTLIASLLRHIIQNHQKHVLTCEEPIEYDLKQVKNRKSRVTQSEVPTNISSFSVSVANALRRSPDVILMGELRDPESIEGGILAAQTGHLVWATGHTNDVGSALDRLADEFPAEEQKSKLLKMVAAIKGIIHQRLLPNLKGGRVAVQERLFFTQIMKMRLFAAIKSSAGLTEELTKLVMDYGLPLKEDIKDKFSQGLLFLDDCLIQTAESLTDEDIEFYKQHTIALSQKGIIGNELKTQWLENLEVFVHEAV